MRIPVSFDRPVQISNVGDTVQAKSGDRYIHATGADSLTIRIDTTNIEYLNGLFVDALLDGTVATRRVTVSMWRRNRVICTVMSGALTAGQELKLSVGPDLDSYDAVVFANTHFQNRSFFRGPYMPGDSILIDILNAGATDTLNAELSTLEIL